MKKTLLLLTGISAATLTHAQSPLHKGRVLLGFSLYSNTNTSRYNGGSTTVDTKSVYLAPAISYFYKDNNSVGLAFSYGRTDYQTIADQKPVNEIWGIALDRSKYWQMGAGFSLAGHFGLGYRHGKSVSFDNLTERRASSDAVNLSFTPGIAYVFRNRLLLELGLNSVAGIQYEHSRTKAEPGFSDSHNSYTVYSSVGQQNPFVFSMNILLGK